MTEEKEILLPIYNKLINDKNLNVIFYQDVYNEKHWYLELCSHKASKFHSTLFIKEKYSFDYIVAFGDNLNDLPLFKASNEAYAVENAKKEVKENATAIIEGNNYDGVAKYLLNKI